MILTAGKYGIRIERNPFTLELRSNLSEPDRWLVEYAGGHPTASGQTMTERTAMQLSAVWCAVGLISGSMSTSPAQLFEKLPNGAGRREADDHPLYPLLHDQPNDEMTASTFWKTLMGHILLWGNLYAEIERNGGGEVVALWPLRPDRTFPRRMIGPDGKGTGKLIYVARSSAGPEVILRPDQVVHVMGYSYDGLRGLSPVALHRESMGLSMAAADYGARFFANDATPGLALKHPAKMKPESSKRLKESWEEAHRGGDQAHRVAILEEGMSIEKIGMSNEDAQYLATRIFQLSEISRMYHVPLHKLGDLTHATFSNIEDQEIEYVKAAVLPWAEAIEQEVFRKLIKPTMPEGKTFYSEFNLEGAMRGDPESRAKYYDVMWKDGFFNADDVLQMENKNPLPDGQGKKYFIPVTQQLLDRAINPPEPPPTGNTGPDGSPLPKGTPKNPPPPTGDPKAKRKHAQELAERRRQVAHAFIPLLGSVGERLSRKEIAALARQGSDADNFFRDHAEYVRAALLPILTCVEESIATLCRAEGHMAAPEEREKFLASYVENYAHRYAKEALVQHIARLGGPGDWANGIADRAHEEAMRASNAFALNIYKTAGAKTLAWILPDTGCTSECASIAARFHDTSRSHPPSGPRCECQIVAVDNA
ncbi:MAG TPA: phage portal protein [Candidatus Dormibacteraeota bacterium]|nr:phage portal protein [Candidatus Dormibacteraeota bacterium]